MSDEKRVENQVVRLKNVRLSYPKLAKAEQYVSNGKPSGKPRFSASFQVEPGSETYKAIEAAIKQAAADRWGKDADKKLKGLRGNSNKFCWVDGDTKDDESAEGKWILTSHRAESQGRPGIYAKDRSQLAPGDEQFPYAGCYVNAMVEIWAQDGENTGIRCTLLSVQFKADGEAFAGGRKPSADDYEDEEEESLA